MRIYKYVFDMSKSTLEIDIPVGSEVLTIQNQRGKPCLWILVNTEEPKKIKRIFAIYGTGQEIPNIKKKYIGTAQFFEGDIIFHCFELLAEN